MQEAGDGQHEEEEGDAGDGEDQRRRPFLHDGAGKKPNRRSTSWPRDDRRKSTNA